MSIVIEPVKKANRLKTSSLNNKLVNDYWSDAFRARSEGRKVCWYEGVAINPLMRDAIYRQLQAARV